MFEEIVECLRVKYKIVNKEKKTDFAKYRLETFENINHLVRLFEVLVKIYPYERFKNLRYIEQGKKVNIFYLKHGDEKMSITLAQKIGK